MGLDRRWDWKGLLLMPALALAAAAACRADERSGQLALADFEAGPGDAVVLAASARITADPAEVIAGAASLRLDTTASGKDWNPCLTTRPGLLPASSRLLLTCSYRWLGQPPGGEPRLYASLRGDDDRQGVSGFMEKTLAEGSGVLQRVFTTPPYGAAQVTIGLRGEGRVSIDDLRLTILPGPPRVGLAQPAGPPADRQWMQVPELSDEFDGPALDRQRWVPGIEGWPGRPPAAFSEANLAVADGLLQLRLARGDYAGDPALAALGPAYHDWTSAAVHSRATLRHGYVEVRARPAAATCSSAFWLSDQRQGEIDVFEIGGGAPDFAYTVNSTLHLLEPGGKPRGPAQRSTWDLDQRPADGFHTYSLDWSAESIVVRVDGVVTARFANTQWHQPMPIILDVETMPDWFGLPHAEEPLPATFQVDYVRTWRAAEP